MPLTYESKQFLTIDTHRGLYRYTQLPFGVVSAPALSQKDKDEILLGLPNVIAALAKSVVA